MKKYLFSRRRGERQKRSLFNWVFNHKMIEGKEATELNDDSEDNLENNNSDKNLSRRQGSQRVNTIIDIDNNNVPSDFYTIASSSNMELSRFSKQNSVSLTKNTSVNNKLSSSKIRRNSKRRKSFKLFNRSSSSKPEVTSSLQTCPVFLYSDSHGLTCMCKS